MSYFILNTNVNFSLNKSSLNNIFFVYNYKLLLFFKDYNCKDLDVYFCKVKLDL